MPISNDHLHDPTPLHRKGSANEPPAIVDWIFWAAVVATLLLICGGLYV